MGSLPGATRRGFAAGLLAVLAAPGRDVAGRRRRCKGGLRRCGKRCVDTLRDDLHCGGCGNACTEGSRCDAGTCCPAGEVNCDGTCRPSCEAAAPARPFPQRVPYPGAVNAVTHRTPEQQADDVRAAYDRWKARHLSARGTDAAGHPLYWVDFNPDGTRTVSEAMGFGMAIVATMAGHDPEAKTVLDGLWRFAREHPSCRDPRLMAWKVAADGSTPEGCSSAFDGDADMAYALLLAEAQWGNGTGLDYRAAFDRLIAGIAESTIGPESDYPMLGDWVQPDGDPHSQWTWRTSDAMPGHFRAWASATGDPRWREVLAASQAGIERLQQAYAPETGLLPDFAEPVGGGDMRPRPADPGFLEGPHDGAFAYNAGRDPWRIGLDAAQSADEASVRQARRISAWARTATDGDPRQLRAGYWLDGRPLPGSDHFSSFFAAPMGVAALVDPGAADWLRAVYDAVVGESQGYYEDSVALLGLLAMTRNAWTPENDAAKPKPRPEKSPRRIP